jgi:DNA-binding NtrC family response regulator
VSDAVKQGFMRYSWPGNVRELENACERIAQTCSCGTVRMGCMPASVLLNAGVDWFPAMPSNASSRPESSTCRSEPMTDGSAAASTGGIPAPVPSAATSTVGAPVEASISLDDRLKEVEANLITWALKASGGNKSKAAELLHIKRSTLGDRINRCGLGRTAAAEAAV